MSENVMLQEAIEAVRQGQRSRARDLLTRLLRQDQSNPDYWLWMSAVVDSAKEQVYCLQSVLRLDPNNTQARQGLALLGATQYQEPATPPTWLQRNWRVELQAEPRQKRASLRMLLMGGTGIVLVGLVILAVVAPQLSRQAVAPRFPTHTPGPPPTFTPTPTYINATAVPTRVTIQPTNKPTELWMLLSATYTPTPVYINTPHPEEAYRVGLQAYNRRDWQGALQALRQLDAQALQAPDILYFMGEAYRFNGDTSQALEAFRAALEIDPNFGPAYVGIARCRLGIDPSANVSNELKNAIEKSPDFSEAYLERARYLLNKSDYKNALKDLQTAEQIIPDSPQLQLLLGEALLQSGEIEQGLEAAQRAVELDVTLLPAYKLLGQAALQNEEYKTAVNALETYTSFGPEDVSGWLLLGRGHYEAGNYKAAGRAYEEAFKLQDQFATTQIGEAFLYRGLTYLALEKPEEALTDLTTAYRYIPRSFEASIALSRASLEMNQLKEARGYLDSARLLAETNPQKAIYYYWHGQVFEASGNLPGALQDWKALLGLPEEDVPSEWAELAQERLDSSLTSTAAAAPTQTKKTSPTPTQVKTIAPTATRVKTATPTPAQTKKATLTSTQAKKTTQAATPTR